jgi:hypothetical protein
MRVVVGLAVLFGVVGCTSGSQQQADPAATPSAAPVSGRTTDDPSSDSSTAENSPGEQQPTTHGPKALIAAPILVGHSQQEALVRVRQWGLKADVHGEPAPCVPAGTVTHQQPRPGARAPKGSTVVLTVAARPVMRPHCEQGVATADDRRLAASFYRFARSPTRGTSR